MADIPKPKSSDERVFVSAYRFDTVRAALVNYLIPAMGVFCLVAFPGWCWRFYQTFDAQAPEEAKARLRLLLGTILLMGLTTALLFFWVSHNLKRKFFDTFVFYDQEGVRLRSGSKEIACRWEEVRELKIREAGRAQTATIVGPSGRIPLDASLFNAHGPRPTVRMGLAGEKLVYPNGYIIPMKIRENELFGVVEKKIAAHKKG